MVMGSTYGMGAMWFTLTILYMSTYQLLLVRTSGEPHILCWLPFLLFCVGATVVAS